MIKTIGGSHVSRYHRRLAGESASTLAGVIGRLIPKDGMIRLRTGTKRRRVFTPVVTFWNFLAQTLSPGQACRETVQRVQAARGRRGQSAISSPLPAPIAAPATSCRSRCLPHSGRPWRPPLTTGRPPPASGGVSVSPSLMAPPSACPTRPRTRPNGHSLRLRNPAAASLS